MRSFEDMVVEHLKIPRDRITDAMTPKDVPDWDSMNYLLFIAELEKEYDVSFTMDEVLGADSIGAVRKLLQNKGKNV